MITSLPLMPKGGEEKALSSPSMSKGEFVGKFYTGLRIDNGCQT